ncbi:MAG: DedA family protein [Thiobacillus sp.]|nr:DedA family protein [Thiobacillus sp.]
MLHDFITWILTTVQDWGYTGIFVLMALESTVLPVPSELVLIPAGYLAHQGQMNFGMILLASTVGSLVGASFNYAVAMWLGRPFLERWGKYCFVRPELLHKTDAFFARHGAVSTFTGRLIPGIRHLISIPAGLTRMNPGAFVFYTCLGAGLWSLVLTLFGYFLGGNEALIREYQHHITVGVIAFVALIIGGYVWWQKRR